MTEPAPATERETLDLRISAGHDIGFLVQEAGHVVAALSTPGELATWIETRLRSVAGEREREAAERADQPTGPRIVQATPPVVRAGLWNRNRG